MKPRKPRASEPSVRDKLNADFTRRLEKKWLEQGDDILDAACKETPTKIVEMIARLIASNEPPAEGIGFKSAQSTHEIAVRLLQSFGVSEPDDTLIAQAVEANDTFIDTLRRIAEQAPQEGRVQ
jgi:hypothetical protein